MDANLYANFGVQKDARDLQMTFQMIFGDQASSIGEKAANFWNGLMADMLAISKV